MPGPCTGLLVLDCSWGMPGGLAGLVLADYGAEVIKIEPPTGDPWRTHPAWRFWNRGKKSVVLDLKTAEGRANAHALAARADVVLEAFRPGVAQRLGIDYDTLHGINPRLVYCSLSSFGQDGPLRNVKGYEAVITARAGRMMAFRGQPDRDGPVYVAVPTISWAASQIAVHGILAALRVRERTARGQWVQTSMLQGLMPYDLQSLVIHRLTQRDPVRWPGDPMVDPKRLATLEYLPVRCKDGRWIQMGNNVLRLFQSFIRAIGLWHIYRDPRFKDAPALTPENRELLRNMILERMAEKTADEWMQIFVEDGDVAAEPFLTTREGMHHVQYVHNGHLALVRDPVVGDMEQPALIADLSASPGTVGGPAPALGQHTQAILALAGRPVENNDALPANGAGAHSNRPLDGVTVLEFATIIAAPYSGALMADLGARVIKVEAPPQGDLYRIMAGGLGTGAAKTTAGKESIVIDLKLEAGLDIVRKLLAKADIVLHNFRPGVAERLGIDYPQAQSFKPDVIYMHLAGYGVSGPFHQRPAFHPLPAAIMGGALRQAGQGNPPAPDVTLTHDEVKEISRRLFRANEANPDYSTTMALVTAMLLALRHRDHTGQGQTVVVTMPCANAYANGDEAYEYSGRPAWRLPDRENHGLHALYRLYRTAAGWIFLACPFQNEWEAFCRTAGRSDLAADVRFTDAAARQQHDAELIGELSALFQTRTAAAWEALLTAADVACVQADAVQTAGQFLAEDPQAVANGLAIPVQHVRFGDILRYGPLMHFSESEGRYEAGVLAGQHTRTLLTELGYTLPQTDALYAQGVVTTEPP